jgi:hypothetical protein
LISGRDLFAPNSWGMKNNPLKRPLNFTVVALLSLLWAGSALAAPTESLLVSAGFKAKAATTAKQRQELRTLPAGKVSPVSQNGKTFYIYPDAQRDQIYVGKAAEYQAYKGLAAKSRGSAGPVVNTDYVRGTQIPVRRFYGFGPLDDMR